MVKPSSAQFTSYTEADRTRRIKEFQANLENALTYLFSIYIFAGTFTFALFQLGKSQSELFTRSLRKSTFVPFGFAFFILTMTTLAIMWARIPPDEFLVSQILYGILVTIGTAIVALLWLVKAVRFFGLGLLLRETNREIRSHLSRLSYVQGTLSAIYPYARPNTYGALRQLYLHPNADFFHHDARTSRAKSNPHSFQQYGR